tara:strand:- start:2370 stop:4229 length:1860 start_codon:yes stop_codon:yes gene_type:complete
MKNLQNIIKQIFECHQSYQEFFDDFDDISLKFSRAEERILECLSMTPEGKWNDQMALKAINIIKKHKDDLLEMEFDIDFIDFEAIDKEKNKPTAILKDGKIEILEVTKDIENNTYYNLYLNNKSSKINYSTVYSIIMLFSENLINICPNLNKSINTFLNNIDYNNNKSIDKKIDNKNYSVELLDFQEVGTLFGLLNKRVIIADEMGLGKTIQSLSIISKQRNFPLFIVCPKSLKYKWEKEALKINDVSIEVYSKKTDIKNISSDIYIFTYNDIPKVIDILEKHKNIKSLIFDESHYLKDKKTVRAKSCKKLSTNKEFIIELSGSPVLNKTSELLNQIEIIGRTNIFGSNIDFLNNYCKREKIYKREDFEAFNHKEEEENLIHLSKTMKENFYIRRKKSETLKSLPDKRRDFLYVDIDNKSEYKKTIDLYKNEKNQKIKKQLLSKLKEVAAAGKFEAIKEQINDFIDNDEKIIVFAYHRKMQNKLLKEYPEALKITADQNEKERFESQEEFLNNPYKKIIICSIRAGYYGLDLYSSSQIIFTEMDWTPEINKQCEDRAHRIGLQHPVNVWYIIAKNTIEEKIVKINKEKIDVINKVNQEFDDFIIERYEDDIKNKLLESL